MIIKVELTEQEVMLAIAEYISSSTGVEVNSKSLNVEVKSKQNFRSEWETAAIRVKCDIFKREGEA